MGKWIALLTLGCFVTLASYAQGFKHRLPAHFGKEVVLLRWDKTARARAVLDIWGDEAQNTTH